MWALDRFNRYGGYLELKWARHIYTLKARNRYFPFVTYFPSNLAYLECVNDTILFQCTLSEIMNEARRSPKTKIQRKQIIFKRNSDFPPALRRNVHPCAMCCMYTCAERRLSMRAENI